MILRRVIEHVKTQHWTAIWIDLLIVILGVFIGIQVSNWNSERADRSAEKRHLEEIAEDLRADIAIFDKIEKSALQRISSVDAILGETRGISRPSRLKFSSGDVYDIPVGIPVQPSDRNILITHANLIGAGGMQSIRDRKIGRQIQKYYADMDDLRSIQNMLRVIRNDGVKIGYSLGLSTFTEMDEQKLIAVVRGNASYSAYLRTVREWAAIHLGDTKAQKQQALSLLADINKYLGKKGSENP
jgi:hypothetical protein